MASLTTRDDGNNLITMATSDNGTDLAAIIVSANVLAGGSLTRPANTTAYSVGDAVTDTGGAAITFSNLARANGGLLYIPSAFLWTTDMPTPVPEFHLFLFNAAPTAIADNAAFSFNSTDMAKVLGFLRFSSAQYSDFANGRLYMADNVPLSVKCGGSSKSLTGQLKTMTAFTPGNGAVYTVGFPSIQEA